MRPVSGTPADDRGSPTTPGTRAKFSLKTFQSLSIPAFRIIFIATAMDHISINIQMMARTWYIFDLTGQAYMIGVIGTFTGITMVVTSIYGGALADRVEKKTLLLIGTAISTIAGLALSLDILLGYVHWTHLLLAVLVIATAIGLTQSSRQSIIPSLIRREQLLNAISLSSAMSNFTRIGAPAAAGFLISWFGVGYVYLSMTILYALQFIVLLFLPRTGVTARQGPQRSLIVDIGNGFRYLKEHAILMHLILFGFVVVIFGMPFQFLLPVFTEEVLDIGPEGFGTLLSFMAVGALLASLFTASMGDFKRKGQLLIVLTVVYGASMLLFAFSNSYLLAIRIMVPIGIGQSARMTVNTTLVQLNVDDAFRGRVLALYMMTVGLNPIGMLPLSIIADIWSIQISLGICGLVVCGYALAIGLFSPGIRRLS